MGVPHISLGDASLRVAQVRVNGATHTPTTVLDERQEQPGFSPSVHCACCTPLEELWSQPGGVHDLFKFHTVASLFLSLVYCNIRCVFIYLILYSVITMVGVADL